MAASSDQPVTRPLHVWLLLVVITVLMALTMTAPALAQKDRMHLGEALGARVIKPAPKNAPTVVRSERRGAYGQPRVEAPALTETITTKRNGGHP